MSLRNSMLASSYTHKKSAFKTCIAISMFKKMFRLKIITSMICTLYTLLIRGKRMLECLLLLLCLHARNDSK